MLVKIFDEAGKNGVALKFMENASSWKPSLAQMQTDSISYMINSEISSEVLAWFSWTVIDKIEIRLDVPSFKALYNFSKAKLLILILYYCIVFQFGVANFQYRSCKPNFSSGRNILELFYYFWPIFMLSF